MFEMPAELVTIANFRDLPEAMLAKGKLESAGIECFLGDDNMVRMDWFWSNLIGGVKLRVAETDAEEAIHLLEEEIPPELVDSDKARSTNSPRVRVAARSISASDHLTRAFNSRRSSLPVSHCPAGATAGSAISVARNGKFLPT